jgi:hypothetical protein
MQSTDDVNFGDPIPQHLTEPFNVFVNSEFKCLWVSGKLAESAKGTAGVANVAVVQMDIDNIVGLILMPLPPDIIGEITERQQIASLIQPNAILYAQPDTRENLLGDVSDFRPNDQLLHNLTSLKCSEKNLPQKTQVFTAWGCKHALSVLSFLPNGGRPNGGTEGNDFGK